MSHIHIKLMLELKTEFKNVGHVRYNIPSRHILQHTDFQLASFQTQIRIYLMFVNALTDVKCCN